MRNTTSAERTKQHHQNKANNDPEFQKKETKRISDLQRQECVSMSEEVLSTFERNIDQKFMHGEPKPKQKKF